MKKLRGQQQSMESKLEEQIIIHEKTIKEFTSRITIVERELIESREYIQHTQGDGQKAEQLAIELEREKGRFAG